MAQYEEAVRLKPDFAEAEGNLGALLCGAGRLEEGVERFRAALRANPNLVTAHLALGAAFLNLGQPGEAADEYEIVLRLRPNDPTALEECWRRSAFHLSGGMPRRMLKAGWGSGVRHEPRDALKFQGTATIMR